MESTAEWCRHSSYRNKLHADTTIFVKLSSIDWSQDYPIVDTVGFLDEFVFLYVSSSMCAKFELDRLLPTTSRSPFKISEH